MTSWVICGGCIPKNPKHVFLFFSVEVFQSRKTKTPIGFGFLDTFWSVG